MRYTKRIMALALACLIIFSLVPPVTVHAASNKAITFLTNNGILQGYGSGNLGLKDAITREQFVTFLYRVAGEPSVQGPSQFVDVKAGSYYYNAVLWAGQEKITNGVSKTRFGVGSKVTCEQAVTFLYRFGNKIFGSTSTNMKKGVFPSGYTNYNSSGKCPEMRDALAWAYRHKLTDGTSDTMKKGTNACVRGDVAQLIYNFYKAFRKTYGLAAMTKDAGVPYAPALMSERFDDYGKVEVVIPQDGLDTYAELQTEFSKAYGSATCIDVCYLYINSHGAESGLTTGTPRRCWLTPEQLEGLTAKYPAKFVILIESCFAGGFVTYFSDHKSKADILCSSNKTPACAVTLYKDDTKIRDGAVPLATACWNLSLAGEKPFADYGTNMSLKAHSTNVMNTRTYCMTSKGNRDGFVSIAELYDAAKNAIANLSLCNEDMENKQDPCY